MAQVKLVAYYRVSTDRQGRSGLGLDAQREAVQRHASGCAGKLIAEFTEVESGKNNARPKLAEALAQCRLTGATLIIAKLDRLARNVHFVSGLMESGVDFVATDFPQANRLTVHILAAVAEHEAAAISVRTKAALAAAKARGQKLGNPGNLSDDAKVMGRELGTAKRARKATDRASQVATVIDTVRKEHGPTASLRVLASELDKRGIAAPRGGQWSAAQVKRVIDRAQAQ